MPPIKTSQKIIKVLANRNAQEDLIGIAFDFCIDQPISSWIKPEDLIKNIEKYFDPTAFGSILQKEIPTMIENWKQKAQSQGQSLKDFLTAEIQAELRFWAGSPLHLSSRQIQSWVNHPLTEQILSQLIRDSLERFVSTIKPGGQGGGLVGSLGRTALSFASKTTKGLFSGLSDQFEDQFKDLIGQFIQSSMHSILQRLALLLSAADVAQTLGESRLELYEGLLKKPLKDLLEQAQGYSTEVWSEMIPDLIFFQLNRDFVRNGLIEESNRLLGIYGQDPMRKYLGSDEKIQALRTESIGQIQPKIDAFVQTQAFLDWAEKYF
jgi:hypothetical protein